METTIREKTYDFAGEAVTIREEVKSGMIEEMKSKRKSLASTFGLDR